jgi:hypothetical protein
MAGSSQRQSLFDAANSSGAFASDSRSDDGVQEHVLAYLKGLPPLEVKGVPESNNPPCKMCGHETEEFTAVDFYQSCNEEDDFGESGILVKYVRCKDCECIFTSFCDNWTAQDFVDLIYNDDYIKVDKEFTGKRGRRTAASLATIFAGGEDKRLLDYGSGAGHFATALKERGFSNSHSFDPYTHPTRPEGRFDIVTAFDVIEHSPSPVQTLHDMLNLTTEDGCILVGQTLQPPDIEKIRGDWWYLAPRNGHISLFSDETIRQFAIREGLIFDNFGALFSLSRPGRSELTKKIIERGEPVDVRVTLFAPERLDGEPFGWHPFESEPEFDYRWTANREVYLGDHDLEGERELVVPYHLAIEDVFLTNSMLQVGDTILPLKRRGKTLTAWFETGPKTRYPIKLITPEPVVPHNSEAIGDVRKLGIAVLSNDRRGWQ